MRTILASLLFAALALVVPRAHATPGDEPDAPAADEDVAVERRRPPGLAAVAGACGEYTRLQDDDLVLRDEWDPILFRGVGSPGHGHEVTVTGQAAWRDGYGALTDGGEADGLLDLRARGVVVNDFEWARRSCLVAEVALGYALDDALGSVAAGLTFLSRQQHDRLRFEMGVDFAFPSSVSSYESNYVRTALVGAVARVDESYRLLPNLQWSARGRLRFETRGDLGPASVWFSLFGYIGGAGMDTAVGSVTGLLGGATATVFLGSGRLDDGRGGFRAGGRASMSVSSLWPTDVIFPLNADGVLQGAFFSPEDRIGFEVELFFGAVGVNYLLSDEWWLQGGLRATIHFDFSPVWPWPAVRTVSR